jgi:hypothetical protein
MQRDAAVQKRACPRITSGRGVRWSYYADPAHPDGRA